MAYPTRLFSGRGGIVLAAISASFMMGGCATTKFQQENERKILQDVVTQMKALEDRVDESQKKTEEKFDRLWVGLNDLRHRQKAQEEKLAALEYGETPPLSFEGPKPKPFTPPPVRVKPPKKTRNIPPVPLRLHPPLHNQGSEKASSVGTVQKDLKLLESIEDPTFKLFLKAQKAYIEKDYPKARAAAQQLLSSYPEAELADDAQFLLAESFFAQGLFANALYEYDTVATRYPKGNKAADALLKEAECYERLNLKEDALKVLGRLIRSYPNALQSVQAKEFIAKLTSPSS